jgi:hypothetical protein
VLIFGICPADLRFAVRTIPAPAAVNGESTTNGILPMDNRQLRAPVALLPQAPILAKQTYASPMSYVGITRRTTAWVRRVGTSNPAAAAAAWFAALIFLGGMYSVLVLWYFVTVVIFGWLLVPFRIIRRSHRRQEHLQRQQLATMQAMLVQQQMVLHQSNVAP